MRRLAEIFKRDRQFRRFIWVKIGAHSNTMIAAFLMVYGMYTLGLTEKATGGFVLATTISGIIASLYIGRLADRFNHKTVLILMLLSSGGAAVIALAVHSLAAMYAAFVSLSISRTCMMVSQENIVWEFAPEGKRPSYIGLANTLSAPFLVLYSVTGGLLARFGYSYPLIAGTAVTLLTIPVLLSMSDPRSAKTAPNPQ
jgi:MFS family permease